MGLFLLDSIPMPFCRKAMLLVSALLVLCLNTGQWSRTFRDFAIFVKRIALLPYVFRGWHWLGRHEVNPMIASKDKDKLAGCSPTWEWMCFVCGRPDCCGSTDTWSSLFADMLNYTSKDRKEPLAAPSALIIMVGLRTSFRIQQAKVMGIFSFIVVKTRLDGWRVTQKPIGTARQGVKEAVCRGAFLSRVSIARLETSPCLQAQNAARYRCRQLQGARRSVDHSWHKTNQSGASSSVDSVARCLTRAVSGVAGDRYSSCCSLHALSRSLYHTAKV
jgi:hypothetical protein